MTTLLDIKQLQVQINQKKICFDFNLKIKKGLFCGILGPNGCGKTTFLQTLAGLTPPSSGDIYLQNIPLNKINKKKLAKEIGFLFQDDIPLFSQTVLEYCLTGRNPYRQNFMWENEIENEIAKKSLQQVGLADQYNKKINTLSGGEKRRLAIATLLTQTPSIYLLDEPLNHLDIHHQINILKHFKSLSDSAVIVSLHDLNFAEQFCNYIILLFNNGNYMMGPPEKMLTIEHLSDLYETPLDKISYHKKNFWVNLLSP